jgi:hypothetical protein
MRGGDAVASAGKEEPARRTKGLKVGFKSLRKAGRPFHGRPFLLKDLTALAELAGCRQRSDRSDASVLVACCQAFENSGVVLLQGAGI